METNYYKSGVWNVICDRCGVKMKSDEVQKTWDGLYVCKADFETRHIADFIKGSKPVTALPFTRPEGADVEVGPTYISTSTGSQDTTIPSAPSGLGGVL